MNNIDEEVEYNRAVLNPEIIKSYMPDRGVQNAVPPQGGSGLAVTNSAQPTSQEMSPSLPISNPEPSNRVISYEDAE